MRTDRFRLLQSPITVLIVALVGMATGSGCFSGSVKQLRGEIFTEPAGQGVRLTVNLLREVDLRTALPFTYAEAVLSYPTDRLSCSEVDPADGFVNMGSRQTETGFRISARYENRIHSRYRIPVATLRCRRITDEPVTISGEMVLTQIVRPYLDVELKNDTQIRLPPVTLPPQSGEGEGK